MSFPYHITDTSFSVFVGGKMLQTDRTNPTFDQIVKLVNDPATTEEMLFNALKPIGAVAEALNGVVDVQVFGGGVYVNGEEIHTSLAMRVLDIAAHGFDLEPWVRFVQNVYANPLGAPVREEFFPWWEKAELPITGDGCFYAYKIVNEDYTDIFSAQYNGSGGKSGGQYDNSIGQVVVMKGGRDAVDPNRRNACSTGLHFCSKGYLPQYGTHKGARVLIIKVNPADVVAFPEDSGLSKGRTWRYEVVAEISRDLAGIKPWLPIDTTWDSPDADAPDFEPVLVDVSGDVFVATKDYGNLTPGAFVAMRENNGGSNRGLARALGVPVGTVGGWVASFRKRGVQV